MNKLSILPLFVLLALLPLACFSLVNIHNCQELQDMNNAPLSNHVLVQDINCGGFQFTPIQGFQAKLNGRGFAIHDLTISDPAGSDVGIFARIYRVEVFDLVLRDINVEGGAFVGALAGQARESIFRNIRLTSSTGMSNQVHATVGRAGGISGAFAECTVEDMIVENTLVSSSGDYAGGVLGVSQECTMTRVHNLGFSNPSTVIVEGQTIGVGGLFGILIGGSTVKCGVQAGEISGGKRVGGFSGIILTGIATDIRECYVTESVMVYSSSNSAGGFAGVISDNGSPNFTARFRDIEVRARVQGHSAVGGFAGLLEASATPIPLLTLDRAAFNSDVSTDPSFRPGYIFGAYSGSVPTVFLTNVLYVEFPVAGSLAFQFDGVPSFNQATPQPSNSVMDSTALSGVLNQNVWYNAYLRSRHGNNFPSQCGTCPPATPHCVLFNSVYACRECAVSAHCTGLTNHCNSNFVCVTRGAQTHPGGYTPVGPPAPPLTPVAPPSPAPSPPAEEQSIAKPSKGRSILKSR